MKRELEDQLKVDFPVVFEDMHNPDLQGYSAMKFGCSCEDGWYEIIRWAAEQYGAWSERTGVSIKFIQVKEKFGQLRIYWKLGKTLEDDQYDGLVAIDSELIAKSDRTCEFCGAVSEEPYGCRASEGKFWIRTLCPACRKVDEQPKKTEAEA